MNKKFIVSLILFLAVTIFAVFALANNQKELVNPVMMTGQNPVQQSNGDANQEASGIVLYYGDGCPHCALVEEFVTENNIEAEVSFAKKEVYYNKQNASELAEKAMTCGMPTDSIGVPFLWDGSECLVGDQDIIEFFKSKINE